MSLKNVYLARISYQCMLRKIYNHEDYFNLAQMASHFTTLLCYSDTLKLLILIRTALFKYIFHAIVSVKKILIRYFKVIYRYCCGISATLQVVILETYRWMPRLSKATMSILYKV